MPLAGTPKCMFPSRPRLGPVRPAEELGEHLGGGHAAREVAGELAVERCDHVVGPERETGSGRDRLLPQARVDGAGDPPLPVEGDDPLLDAALEQHQPVELSTQASSSRAARYLRG